MTDLTKELHRVEEITKRLAFSTPNMDQNNPIDHLAFKEYWNTLVGYITPAGAVILTAVSAHLTDVEVGYVAMSLTRAMVAKRKGESEDDGARFLAQALAHKVSLTCTVAESALVEGLAKSEEDGCDMADSDLEQQVLVRMPRERTKLATKNGKVIDLTEIFKGR